MKALEEAIQTPSSRKTETRHQDFFQEDILRLQINLEFQNSLFQVRRRKECNHVCLPFRFEKQSHVTKIVDVWRHSQPIILV